MSQLKCCCVFGYCNFLPEEKQQTCKSTQCPWQQMLQYFTFVTFGKVILCFPHFMVHINNFKPIIYLIVINDTLNSITLGSH